MTSDRNALPLVGWSRPIGLLLGIAVVAGFVTPLRGQTQTVGGGPHWDDLQQVAGPTAKVVGLIRKGGGQGDNVGTRGGCPDQVRTYCNSNFSGTLIAAPAEGIVNGEILAVSYTVDPSHFPITFVRSEMMWIQTHGTATITQYTFQLYQGFPTSEQLVSEFPSGDVAPDLPPVRLPVGSARALNLTIEVDPQDTELITIDDDGSHTFSVAFRIDALNHPATAPCCFGFQPTQCCPAPKTLNAFPAFDSDGATYPNNNWLKSLDGCGICAVPGGWHSMQDLLNLGASPNEVADWSMRVTYTPANCGAQGPVISNVSPNTATNTGSAHVVITGGNFINNQTVVQLNKSGQSSITATNVVVSGGGTIINCDLDLTGAFATPPNNHWDVFVVTSVSPAATLTNGFTITTPQPPTVSSVSPNTSPNNLILHAFIAGTNFQQTGTTALLRMMNTVIPGTNVVFNSNSIIECDFDIRGATLGFYRCEVTTPVNGGSTGGRDNAIELTGLPPPSVIGGLFNGDTSISDCPGGAVLEVFGDNFQENCEVRLVNIGQPDRVSSFVSFDNSTHIYASFDMEGMVVGSWDVRVINPDLQGANSEVPVDVLACTPTVSSIAPATANNHQSALNITNLSGDNFLPGATVRLRRAGQPDIVATNVVRVNATRITCTLNLVSPNLAQAGAWDVVVTNPGNAEGVLPNGFSVASIAPTVGLLSPATVQNCGVVHMIVPGTNLLAGATVKLELTAGSPPTYVGTNVTFVNATRIEADFNLVGVPITVGTERLDCTVTNPDNLSAVGTNRVTVTACSISCTKGDMNGDGLKDGADVNAFVRVLISQTGTTTELCAADLVAPNGTINSADAAAFVNCLLTGNCP